MPNHETNTVVVVGPPDNVRQFRDEAFTVVNGVLGLDFNKVTPQPENIERGGCSGTHAEGEVCWFTWRIENWGTKWAAYSHTEPVYALFEAMAGDQYLARLDFTFQTAWDAPTPVFEAIESRWGVKVHAVTQDEGGFPDTEHGEPSLYLKKTFVVEYW